MSKPAAKKHSDPKIEIKRLRRRLFIGMCVAMVFAAIAGGLSWWDASHEVPAEKLVTVYRVHGCRCAFTWARTLEAKGFTVRLHEWETLRDIRMQLSTPKGFNGCHIARYLNYFVEGHVDPAALTKLAAERPVARGISTEPIDERNHAGRPPHDENGPTLLFDREGRTQLWFTTAAAPKESSFKL